MQIFLRINHFVNCLNKNKRDQDVNEEGIKYSDMKLRKAAAVYNVKPNILFYRIIKYKENKIYNDRVFSFK